jgi:hypothetical protein
VIRFLGYDPDCLNIHHINEDISDNRLDNLSPLHRKCHQRLHKRKKKKR